MSVTLLHITWEKLALQIKAVCAEGGAGGREKEVVRMDEEVEEICGRVGGKKMSKNRRENESPLNSRHNNAEPAR